MYMKLGEDEEADNKLGELLSGIGSLLASEAAVAQVALPGTLCSRLAHMNSACSKTRPEERLHHLPMHWHGCMSHLRLRGCAIRGAHCSTTKLLHRQRPCASLSKSEQLCIVGGTCRRALTVRAGGSALPGAQGQAAGGELPGRRCAEHPQQHPLAGLQRRGRLRLAQDGRALRNAHSGAQHCCFGPRSCCCTSANRHGPPLLISCVM